MRSFALFLAAISALASFPALAQGSKPITRTGDWEAYAYAEKSGKVCYAASIAKKKSGDIPGRGEAFLMITHGPGKSVNIVSLVPGFAFKDGSEVELEAGSFKVKLFTKGDTAWARAGDDVKLIAALQKSKELIAKSIPAKGKPAQDSFSLKGFGEIYADINKACGVK
jgi:hypothetical protein